MSPITITLVSNVVTFVLSLFVTLFVAGFRLGQIKSDLASTKNDVAQIKGMFVLTLRDVNKGG